MTGLRVFRRNADGERGAVLVFAAVGIVVAILAAAMAIDVGSVIWRKRDLQVVADIAAADTAKQLAVAPSVTQVVADQLGREAASRNDFDFTTTGNSLTVVLGTYDSSRTPAFAALPAPDVALSNAVQVVAVREVPFNFAPGSNTVTTKAVASFDSEARAAFSIGSKLVGLDTRSSNVLGPVLSELLGVNPALSGGVVTYEGLASSNVELGDLAAELGFANVEELLAGNVTVPQLADASARILDREGTADASVITALTKIAVDGDSSVDSESILFGSIVDVEQGQGDAAVSMGINVLDLLTSAGQRAQVANGTTFLTVPLNVAIPGLTSSVLRLDFIQPPVISVFGPVGTQASTAQLTTTLTNRIQVEEPPVCTTTLGLTTCLPSALSVDLTMPIVITAAGATGTTDAIDCAVAPPETPVAIGVATQAADATTAAILSGKVDGVAVADNVALAEGRVPAGSGTASTLTFPKRPGDPTPMVFPSVIQSTVGAQTLATDLIDRTDGDGISLSVLGLENVDPALALLTPVTNQIDSVILKLILDALGLSVGGADLRTLRVECPGGGARLVE